MPAKGKWEYYSENELKEIYKDSSSYQDFFIKLGYARYNASTMKKMKEKYPWLLEKKFCGNDLTGQKFGKLLVLERVGYDSNVGKTIWKCKCDCGNIVTKYTASLTSHNCRSCGCSSTEFQKKSLAKDLTGQSFGRLTPLYRDEHNFQKWICQCDCGKLCSIPTGSLTSGHTKSCGCLQREFTKNINFIDLTGQKFGKLTVIKQDISKSKEYKQAYWICKCDCGNITSSGSNGLRTGHIQSCGCVKSHGERLISMFLKENNIAFVKEFSFSDLKSKTNTLLRFDFALYVENELKCLIEYNGIQHYYPIKGWGGKEAFKESLERDLLKKEYCKNNNIKMFTISYEDFSVLNQKLIEICKECDIHLKEELKNEI